MTSPLVNPEGYSTLSRLLSESCRPSTSVVMLWLRAGLTGSRGLLRLRGSLARGRVPLAGRLGRLDAGFQRRHQVDDLRLLGRRLRHLELLAGRLLGDQIEHLLAVVVVELVGLEVVGERLDERFGHLDLAIGDVDVLQSAQLI